jgi:3-oxoacyl-[acyl-carrier-protein] synthase-1
LSEFFLGAPGIVCALGQGRAEVARALFATDKPMGVAAREWHDGRKLALGAVTADLPAMDDVSARWRGRNNALLRCALEPLREAVAEARARHGASRIGVVLGTSTSGIGESEAAQVHFETTGRWPEQFHYGQQEMGTPAAFVAAQLRLAGPAHTISTACSSSTKAIAAGARMLQAGLADAVVVGGADSLCRFTVAGFSALDSVSAERCNPFSRHRRGINIGEGAALFLLDRQAGPVRLAGWGESSDAHHMSAPEPSGQGAERAVRDALARAQLRPGDLDYLNLHGTATPHNDAMEAAMVARVFGMDMPCSSTKPLTGHALGAAGALEAALCWITLAENPRQQLPPHWWDGEADPQLESFGLVAPGQRLGSAPRHILSQNFAFGGSNAALVLGAG